MYKLMVNRSDIYIFHAIYNIWSIAHFLFVLCVNVNVTRGWMQKLYSDKRKEKLELLKGLSFAQDDTTNVSPLQQVTNL